MEQSLVTFGTDNGKTLVVDATLIKNTRKFALCLLQLGACLDTFPFQQTLLYQLGTACLNGKVGLRKSYLRLAWVAILRQKIAGIACEHDVIYLTLST